MRMATASLLVGAALLNLPVVHRLIVDDETAPPIALGFGFLSMGLGWAAGFVIEGRRRWFVLLMAGVGVAEAIVAFAPTGWNGSRAYLVGAAALSAAAMFLFARTPNVEA